MKKSKNSIDQLKRLSVSVIGKDQQCKLKGGVDKRKIKRVHVG